MCNKDKERGSMIIEGIVSMALLAVVLGASAHLFTQSIATSAVFRKGVPLNIFINEEVERLRSKRYADLVSTYNLSPDNLTNATTLTDPNSKIPVTFTLTAIYLGSTDGLPSWIDLLVSAPRSSTNGTLELRTSISHVR